MSNLRLKTTQNFIQKTLNPTKTNTLSEFIINSPLSQNQDINLERDISFTRKISIKSTKSK